MSTVFLFLACLSPSFALEDQESANSGLADQDDFFIPVRIDESLPEEVVGGSPVSGKRWDATVGIVFYGSYVGCTGTLVEKKTVITAAHCTGGISHVLIGAKDWWYDWEDADVEFLSVDLERGHPDYNGWTGPDIAVLTLDQKSNYEPAVIGMECITDRYLDNGVKVEVVGYGNTNANGGGYTSELNHGTTVVQTYDCMDDVVDGVWTGCDPTQQPGGEIGAGGNGVDACFGDSGGPLYIKTDEGDYVIGATSRAYAGASSSYPCRDGGIYTRPDKYYKWLKDTSGRSIPTPVCNDAPELTVDELILRPGDSASVAVVVTDPDGDAELATYEISTDPLHGTAEVAADGTITYTANADYVGEDSLIVSVTDAGNDDHRWSGDPVTVDLEVPVTVSEDAPGPEDEGGGLGSMLCGCQTTGVGSTMVWFALLPLLSLRRRE